MLTITTIFQQELAQICDHGGNCAWGTVPVVKEDGNIQGNQCRLELVCNPEIMVCQQKL